MELRYYLAIVRRRWPLVIGLPLLVALLSGAAAFNQPQRYSLTARLLVTQTPLARVATDADNPDLNSVGNWQASEYLLDDLPQVLSSAAFATDVSALLAAQGYTISPGTVQGAIVGTTTHRSLDIDVTTDRPEDAVAIARGAAEALKANGLAYWNRVSPDDGPGLQVAVLTLPESATPLNSRRRALTDVALRTALALATAVGLAFLLHSLDRTVQNREQAESLLGAPVLGAIPRDRAATRKR